MSERYLANENFPARIVSFLRKRGDDVLSAAQDLTGASDEAVLSRSIQDDRILLTFDRDFGALAFHQRMPATSGIVLFRLKQLPPHVIHHFLQTFFDSQPILRGMFTVSSPGQLRQILLSKSTRPPSQ